MKSTRHIYRIQDADGRGPWRPGYSEQWAEDRPEFATLLPWFMEWPNLRLPRRGGHFGCGCLSAEQLRLWFTEIEYKRLLAMRFDAVRLNDVQIIASGPTQCVFARAIPLREEARPFELYDSPADATQASSSAPVSS